MSINYKDFNAVGSTAQQLGAVPVSVQLVNTWLSTVANAVKVINMETLFDAQGYPSGIRVWYSHD